MTTFTNGPAQGQTLMLKRAPRFLRVVEAAGKWDALDQLEDQPQPNETIHVYVLQGKPGSVHLNRGRGRGGWYVFANYQIYPQQPTDDQMRSTAKWRSWCQSKASAS